MDRDITTPITAAYDHLTKGTPVGDDTVRALATLIDRNPDTRDALIMCALSADDMTAADTVDAARPPTTVG